MHKILIFVVLFIGVSAHAQEDVLYNNLSDPRSIFTIDSSTSSPLQYSTGNIYPSASDSTDNYSILASDSGSGVVTHFWMTMPQTVDTAYVKLYIDDKLVKWQPMYSFFDDSVGLFRHPFSTKTPEANVCDIQLSYTKSFKITVERIASQVWYAVAWRHLPSSIAFPFDPLTTNALQKQSQEKGEEAVRNTNNNPWGNIGLMIQTSLPIDPHNLTTCSSLNGPGVIYSLSVSLDRYDTQLLDSMSLVINWDNSSQPSVDVPLSDFFCIPSDGFKVNSFPIRVNKDSGLTCYFPMPFFQSAKIGIRNTSTQHVNCNLACQYNSEPVDIRRMGYFFAKFSETKRTRYGIFHPVLNEQGTGRLVGLTLSIPNNSHPVSLEGDPIITIDNKESNTIHYTGTEDYFDGGFYFAFKLFSMPFCGHTELFKKFYRFHILDHIDFTRQIQFLFQHGVNNDVHEHYRTCAYYYKLWTPYVTSRDTLRANENWVISGSGYTPNSEVKGNFEDGENAFSTFAGSDSSFSVSLVVPYSWKGGKRTLSVNGIVKPEPIYILDTAKLRPIADTLPPIVKYLDSLLVTGTGFSPGEKITFFLDSIPVDETSEVVVGDDYRFFGTIKIPNISDSWKYHLVGEGNRGNRAICEQLISVTRDRSFEFEELLPGAQWDAGSCNIANRSGNWYTRWSKQETADFDPTGIGHHISFPFVIPVADTFALRMVLTNGDRYGIYSYSVDGRQLGFFDGFKQFYPGYDPQASDTVLIDTQYLSSGSHTITFNCIAKDSAAIGYLLGADILFVQPVTKMPLSKGTWDNTAEVRKKDTLIPIHPFLYPNPITGASFNLNLHAISATSAMVKIIDQSGRTLSTMTVCDDQKKIPFDNSSGSYLLDCMAITPIGPRHITVPFVVLR
ncbi:MAG TPA: DUF2961 domain-containing protein [Candidatus Kapabacteria bacterium]|nr:DUF2961 domain-containing protein [Candidatus Kapabacteria bacterium]